MQRVPSGYYLLVTDVVVTPDGGTDTSATINDVILYDAYGSNGRAYSIRFRSLGTGTFSEHFTTPYMVLPAGHRLEAAAAWFNDDWLFVQVSGLLVTNVSCQPLILRDQ
ncbi:MAG: hypothetical protein H5T59_11145 [Anaerolineae bacterium]|nr:hypothetical protein [Anaerolineae bacterium]